MLPEHFRTLANHDLKDKVMNEGLETQHFGNKKMLIDEPDLGLFKGLGATEEDKFD